jgi:uncharacterized membrane protein
MSWLQRYRVRAYFKNSIWVLPALSMPAALAAVRGLHGVEQALGWQPGSHTETARAVLGTMAASMFTFVVFVSSALLVAVQLASAQLTPRIIPFVFRDPITRFSLTIFVFTFTFTLAALVRITDSVPMLTAECAAYSCLASLGVFLYMIDHVGKALRPSGALQAVGRLGHAVIANVYPRSLAASRELPPSPADLPELNKKPSAVVASPREGVVLAFDIRGLVSLARGAGCVIELVPQVGDSVAVGDPLFRVFGGAALSADALCQSVAVGMERTIEQDPAFVFRILVDVASKGLSPAINDPTTAVLVIDQVHHLLSAVGNRWLDEGHVRDAEGRLLLVYRTPDWENFVHLAVTEIRQFGGGSIQVVRRLRAMLEHLLATLPAARLPLLRRELSVLKRLAERFFPEPEDRALADVSDSQGVGGAHGPHRGRGEASPGAGQATPASAPLDVVPARAADRQISEETAP